MLVIAILGILLAIALPNYQGYVKQAKYRVVISTLHTIERECIAFEIANNRYPDTLSETGLGNLKDPWGNNYQYLNVQTAKGKGKLRKDRNLVPVNTDFDLYSMGPDGDTRTPFTAPQSFDDIVRAANGGYYGWASTY